MRSAPRRWPPRRARPRRAAAPTARATTTPTRRSRQPLGPGLRAFYARDFAAARQGLRSGAGGRARQHAGALVPATPPRRRRRASSTRLVDAEEDGLAKSPKSALAHVRLGLLVPVRVADRARPQRRRARGAQRRRRSSTRPRRPRTRAWASCASPSAAPTGRRPSSSPRSSSRPEQRAGARVPLAHLPDRSQGSAARADHDHRRAEPGAGLRRHRLPPRLALQDLGQYDAAIDYATRGLQADVGHVGEAGQHGYTLLARIYLDSRRSPTTRAGCCAPRSRAGSDVAYASTLLRKLDDGGRQAEPSPSPAPSALAEEEVSAASGRRRPLLRLRSVQRRRAAPALRAGRRRRRARRDHAAAALSGLARDRARRHRDDAARRGDGARLRPASASAAMTAAMELRFRAPVPLGEPLVVTGSVRWKRRKVIALAAEIALRRRHAPGRRRGLVRLGRAARRGAAGQSGRRCPGAPADGQHEAGRARRPRSTSRPRSRRSTTGGRASSTRSSSRSKSGSRSRAARSSRSATATCRSTRASRACARASCGC